MKKRTKLFAAMLACAMLAACGQTNPPSSSQSQADTSKVQSSQTQSESQPEDTADRPKLNMLIPYAPFDVKTDNAVKELSKHTGYEIEFDTLPEQNSNDRLNLIFSSGNIDYDYIRIGSGDVEAGMFFQQVFDEAGDYLEVNPIAFAPSFDGISDKVKVVQEYALQEATKFIAGARSLDEFDAFVEEMNAKGSAEIVEAYNQWYEKG